MIWYDSKGNHLTYVVSRGAQACHKIWIHEINDQITTVDVVNCNGLPWAPYFLFAPAHTATSLIHMCLLKSPYPLRIGCIYIVLKKIPIQYNMLWIEIRWYPSTVPLFSLKKKPFGKGYPFKAKQILLLCHESPVTFILLYRVYLDFRFWSLTNNNFGMFDQLCL